MAKNSPVRGPFPDGDSRNITLTQNNSPIEPTRTGPAEPKYREDGAPDSVIGDLAQTELKEGAEAPQANPVPEAPELGFGALGGTITQAASVSMNMEKRAGSERD